MFNALSSLFAAILVTQSYTEVEIAAKLRADNTTISKDVKALKLISQQFIYDITKSDFTYYYKQCLKLLKHVLRKQMEIVNKDTPIAKEDMGRAKVLVDILGTVTKSTITIMRLLGCTRLLCKQHMMLIDSVLG